MEAVDSSSRKSNVLPSINHLDSGSIKREESDSQKKSEPQTPGTMPNTPYSPAFPRPPPPPSSYPPPPSNYGPAALSGLISPPESRRMSGDEQEQHKQSRQSLPSIHEALNSESRFPQPPPQPAPTSAPVTAPPPYQPHPATPSSEPNHRPFAPELPNPGPAYPAPSPQTTYPSALPTTPASAPPGPPDSLPRPSFSSNNSKLPALHPLRTMQSPVEASRPPYPYQSQSSAPEPSPHSAGHPPYGYGNGSVRPNSNYPYPAPTQNQPGPAYPPTSAYPGPPRYPNNYRNDELNHVEEIKRNGKFGVPAYGESVKRHLDHFDSEASLIEIGDVGRSLVDFAARHSSSHAAHRTGPVSTNLPPLHEVESVLKRSNLLQESLRRLVEVVNTQERAQLEKAQEQQRFQATNGYDEAAQNPYHNDQKGNNAFDGPDPKKRRGRAAPPGRCHSCNRAETPEWRRGPDGARTLCNACGLHYAKLTRKMGSGKAVSNSNLRPKSLGPGSPAS